MVTPTTYIPSKRSKYKTWTENLKRKNLTDDYNDIMGSKPLDLKRFSTSSDKKNFAIKIVCDHCGDRAGLTFYVRPIPRQVDLRALKNINPKKFR